ncbi:MAG: hypothetical protein ACREJ2_09480 [Planctomycetota bacterium]
MSSDRSSALLQRYRPDGKYDPSRVWILPTIAVMTALVASPLYVVAEWNIPDENLRFFVGAVFVLLLAGSVGYGCHLSHNRNILLHLVVSLAQSALSLFVAWAVFLTLISHAQYVKLPNPTPHTVLNPGEMPGDIAAVAAQGYYTKIDTLVNGNQTKESVKGGALWMDWVMEALAALLLPPVLGAVVFREPYFPTAQSWGRRRLRDRWYTPPPGETITADSVNTDPGLEWVSRLRPGRLAPGAVQFVFFEAPKDPTAYLQINTLPPPNKSSQKQGNPRRLVGPLTSSAAQIAMIERKLDAVDATTRAPSVPTQPTAKPTVTPKATSSEWDQ